MSLDYPSRPREPDSARFDYASPYLLPVNTTVAPSVDGVVQPRFAPGISRVEKKCRKPAKPSI